MDKRKDFKRIEHRKHCRICWAVAQLRIGKRYFCALCYHDIFQVQSVDQSPVRLTDEDIVNALLAPTPVVTARVAVAALERSVGR